MPLDGLCLARLFLGLDWTIEGAGLAVASISELCRCRFGSLAQWTFRRYFVAGTLKAIPEGYHSVTPYMICKGASDAIEFYKKAFGAVEVMRMAGPDGRIGHAEIKIGDSHIMLADERPDMGIYSPLHYGGSPVSVLLYVENADATVSAAVGVGAKIVRPVKDEFYGDRAGTITDPFGHQWYIHTHIKEVTPEEMQRAATGS